MATYIVTYDLNNETRRPPIVQAIKAYKTWARLSESSYAIVTDNSPSQVYAYLKQHLDGDDQLYVIALHKPYAGQGSQEVNTWLEQHLVYCP
jgi:hypothetical protein